MRTLETELSFVGHRLRQIWRKADVAIYERSFPGKKPHELELISIKIKHEGMTPTGSMVPEREAYPSPKEWGMYGWSFPVRYKLWVLSLAEKLVAITKARGTFVRQSTSEFCQIRDGRPAATKTQPLEVRS